MFVKNIVLVLCSGLLLSVAPLKAETKAEPLLCPPQVRIASATLANPPDGWTTAVAGSPLKLFSARFYDGPPAELGELKPEYRPDKKGKGKDVFSFDAATTPKGIWLSCDYGTKQEVSLATRIPDRITECTVQYKKIGLEDIRCKSSTPTSSKQFFPRSTY